MKRTQQHAEFAFGCKMNPCPKCGSWNIKYQVPIEIDIPKGASARQILSAWAREQAKGPRLKGYGFIMCFDCGYKGPHVSTEGMTYGQANKSVEFADKMKAAWNNQDKSFADDSERKDPMTDGKDYSHTNTLDKLGYKEGE